LVVLAAFAMTVLKRQQQGSKQPKTKDNGATGSVYQQAAKHGACGYGRTMK